MLSQGHKAEQGETTFCFVLNAEGQVYSTSFKFDFEKLSFIKGTVNFKAD